MAKILISGLGTGNIKKDTDSEYETTCYMLDGKKYPNETLTASAIMKHIGIDKVFFIGTSKAMWDNLYILFSDTDSAFGDEYHEKLCNDKKSTGIKQSDLKKLEQVIDAKLGHQGSKCFNIEYDKNDSQEVWSNFYKLLEIKNFLQDGDEIYLDITHGFRYMSVMNVLLVQFMLLSENPNIILKAVYYGMLSKGLSEIIDFKIFFDLLEWAHSIREFKKYTNATGLLEVLSKSNADNGLQKVFSQLNANLQLANLASLWQFFKNAQKKIEKVSSSNNKVLQLVSDDLLELVNRLNKDKLSLFQYEISKWFYENGQYALSYLALHEAIISKACEDKFPDENIEDPDLRQEVKIRNIDAPYDKMFLEKINSQNPNFNSISSIRNSIAHQRNDRKDMAKQDIERLKYYLKEFESYFASN
jgi:CRISPR-associated Csx2 family protein